MSRACPFLVRTVRMAVLLAVVVGFVVGGVRLFAPPGPPTPGATIETGDPPAEVAYDAMRTTEARSYAVRVVWRFGDGETLLWRKRVDPADRQVRVVRDLRRGPWPAAAAPESYGNQHSGWRRSSGRRGPLAWTLSRGEYESDGEYAHDAAVLDPGANVSVVTANRTTMVVRVNDTDSAHELFTGDADATEYDYWAERNLRASYTLVLDRQTAVLRRSVYRRTALNGTDENAIRETFVAEKHYYDWGAVEVRRPVWAPSSFVELLVAVLEEDG